MALSGLFQPLPGPGLRLKLKMQTQSSPSITPDGFQDPHTRWLAITNRAPASHSSFVYGVVSTKIYCRPTCTARPARRANVVFYDTNDEARRDGFRPCKRCKPDDALFLGDKEEVVLKTLALLWMQDGGLVMKRGLKDLAKEVGVTPSYLCRVFKKTLGVTIRRYCLEFEKESGDFELPSSSQSPNNIESVVPDAGEGFLMPPASTVRSPSIAIGDWRKQLTEGGYVGSLEVDPACSLSLDEWFFD